MLVKKPSTSFNYSNLDQVNNILSGIRSAQNTIDGHPIILPNLLEVLAKAKPDSSRTIKDSICFINQATRQRFVLRKASERSYYLIDVDNGDRKIMISDKSVVDSSRGTYAVLVSNPIIQDLLKLSSEAQGRRIANKTIEHLN